MGNHDGIGAVSFAAAGSWEHDQQGGSALVSEGCTIAHASQGVYDVSLFQPIDKTDFMAGFTWLGATPRDYRFTLEDVSDTVKRFRFKSADGEDNVDASFSFVFTKGSGRH